MKTFKRADALLAGLLKLFLVIMAFFILWSVLALVSSKAMPAVNLLWAQDSTPSSATLAQSLLQEIANSYLSPFTLSVLALVLLAISTGATHARRYYKKFICNFYPGGAWRIFWSQFFPGSFSRSFYLTTTDEVAEFMRSTTALLGPASVHLREDACAVILDCRGIAKFILSNGEMPIFAQVGERLANIFLPDWNPVNVEVINPFQNGGRLALSVSYQLNCENLREMSQDDQAVLASLDLQKIGPLIEPLLRTELTFLLNKYEQEQGGEDSPEKETADNFFINNDRAPHRQYTSYKREPGFSSFKRNRKRRISPPEPLSKSDQAHIDVTPHTYEELVRQRMPEFQKNMDEATSIIFGCEFLNFRIE